MTATPDSENIHHGKNVKRLRELLGIKQEALAISLGEDWSQKRVSRLEEKEIIEDEILDELAKAFKVTPDAIKNFDELAAINIISNTFNNNSHDSSSFYSSALNYQPTFNPIDRVVELYERMLKEKIEMIEKLERLLQEKK